MPTRPERACAWPGCGRLAVAGGLRCEVHATLVPARPHAAARGYDRRWRRVRAMFLAQHPLCQAPGCQAVAVDVHHVVALADGGTHAENNLQALCRAHHVAVHRAMAGG